MAGTKELVVSVVLLCAAVAICATAIHELVIKRPAWDGGHATANGTANCTARTLGHRGHSDPATALPVLPAAPAAPGSRTARATEGRQGVLDDAARRGNASAEAEAKQE
ncbi:uncharacterized protein LOC117650545 [Thrips palmi]|uniref:Uncharacterized protein LOC117650545 n=1 Tax=Thrips palmi TaxID=161013 RepID=A0A6P8ZX28_THRPL|nr:uncharacterized protein LOC117650545 [Thrips palmi]